MLGAHRTFVVLEDQSKMIGKDNSQDVFLAVWLLAKPDLDTGSGLVGFCFLTVPCRNQGTAFRITLFPCTRLFSEVPTAVLVAFPWALIR